MVSVKLEKVITDLLAASTEPSLAELKKAGFTDTDLKRVILIEFGCKESAFEALSPEGYFVDGQWMKISDLGEAFN
jgi:hypothetical protein